MDPGTIIGVASSAIAFLNFAIELVKGTREIYVSLNGATDKNAHVDLVISELHAASVALFVQHTPGRTEHEKALVDLATKCHKKCIKLLEITKKLKIDDHSKWSSFKVAWKTHWKKDDIDQMHGELRDYRLAILLRLNQMQIENAIQADAKLDTILLEFRRPIRDEHEIEASICSRIKHQLHFESIYRREDGISDTGEGTCSWITNTGGDDDDEAGGHGVPPHIAQCEHEARLHARSEYISWLGAGAQSTPQGAQPTAEPSSPSILHISGKAGSGKSTLMRYLFRHEKTRTALETWAGTRTLVLASFYFWVASGDDMQKSLNGLYRTILHDVLHQCPELAVYLFPNQWRELQRRVNRNEEAKDSADAVLFRDKAIQEAFLKLVGPAASNSPLYCFCFFIDGLDEYRERDPHGGGDVKDLSPGFKMLTKKLLQWNSSAHVKFCTTARPYSEFLDPLYRNSAIILHLENVNQCDIYRYCKNAFDEDEDIADMQILYQDLLNEITYRAKGVFLWAVLVVRAMIKSLSRGDSKERQMQKLDAVPTELDNLYTMLLGQVDESDRERSNQLFLLALFLSDCKPEYLPDSISCLDDLTDPSFPDSIPVVLTEADKKQREVQGRRLLNSLTHGMLANHLLGQLSFSHLTAYDYMKERRDRGQLASASLDFDQIDVWGRIHLGDFRNSDDMWHLIHCLAEMQHNKRPDTILRLGKRFQQIIKAALEKENTKTSTHSTLSIMASLTLHKPKVFDTPIEVYNKSAPILCLSPLGLAGMKAHTSSNEYKLKAKFVPDNLLTGEDKTITALLSIVQIRRDFRYRHDELASNLSKWLNVFDFADLNDVRSGALPCPWWMYFAAAMVNYLLYDWLHYIYDLIPPEEFMKTKTLPPYATKCKVALNDRGGTVVTLQQILEVDSVRIKNMGHRKMKREDCFAGNQLKVLRLDVVARCVFRKPLVLTRDDEEDDKEDDKMDDKMDIEGDSDRDSEGDGKEVVGRNWELWERDIYFKYIEFEGFRLDANFEIYIACPDLFK